MNKSIKHIAIAGNIGAGKTTLAKAIGATYFEADMYFMQDGTYHFDPSGLKDAHNWCRHSAMHAMRIGDPTVIVSNTFTQEWEMEAYYLLAEEFGYTVHSVIVENRHDGVNEHGVPEEKLEQMKQRFEIKL
jgi:50S ribosomal subunit-associated GTPase HflX